MNINYITKELNKRKVHFDYFWADAGPAIRFMIPNLKYWNTLLPIDDESDAKFVDFVADNYKKYHGATL